MAVFMDSERKTRARRPFAFFRADARMGASEHKKPILEFEDVYKFFGEEQVALRGLNLTIERGEFVFLTGPSGAGKSTMLRLITRELGIDSGRILFAGKDISRLTERSIPYLRRNLGIVFQDFRVIPHWSVAENISIALEVMGYSSRLIRSRVSEVLERVGLEGRGGDRAGSLSGGEQQRVAIARAIVTEPALILADEPTGNLDPALAVDILTLFEEIHETGTTVLFATHDHGMIERGNHRILSLEKGRVYDVRKGLSSWSASGVHSVREQGLRVVAG